MFDQELRGFKDLLLKPLARPFRTIDPLVITGFGLILGLASAFAASLGWYIPALALWLLNRLADGLDGFIARSFNKKSDLGGYLDLVADFLVYAAIPLGLAWSRAHLNTWIAVAVLLASFYLNAITWLGLATLEAKSASKEAPEPKTSLPMPRGLMEGFETLVLFSLFFLFPASYFWLVCLGSALVLISAGQRIFWAWRGGL